MFGPGLGEEFFQAVAAPVFQLYGVQSGGFEQGREAVALLDDMNGGRAFAPLGGVIIGGAPRDV